ncbi:MAG: AAA family ATPase [Candidatus Latescibacteria bacterium]|nr:AAA family ATPase [Candidatus Latescibacterota bacterium]MBT5831539.1 AAA family ATPase [Candidatus Latescibacterota bacterium]
MTPTRPSVIIINGPPGVGKTTLGKKIADELQLPFISKDNIKDLLFDNLLNLDSDSVAPYFGRTSTEHHQHIRSKHEPHAEPKGHGLSRHLVLQPTLRRRIRL